MNTPVLKSRDAILKDTLDFARSLTLEALARNTPLLRWFQYAASNHSRLIRRAGRLAARVGDHRIVYLLDYDVVRSFCEAPFLDNHVLDYSVDYIVNRSSCQYGIPIGAFESILEYVSYPARVARMMSDLGEGREDIGPSRVRELVSDAIGIGGRESVEDYAVFERRFGRHADQLARLSALISSQRFVGVVRDYEDGIQKRCIGYVRSIRRRDAVPVWASYETDGANSGMQRRRDERDSRNIAICKSDSGTSGVVKVLLTQNVRLLELADGLDVDAAAMADSLSTILAGDAAGLVNHPRVAMIFEMLGGARNCRAAQSRARSHESNLLWLEREVDAQLDYMTSNNPKRLDGAFISGNGLRRAQRLKAALLGVARDLLLANGCARDLEDGLSRELAPAASLTFDIDYNWKVGFSDLAHALSRIEGLMEGATTPIYGAELRTIDSDLTTFEIVSEVSGVRMPIASGEVYPKRGYLVVSWSTNCTEEALVEAMRAIWADASQSRRQRGAGHADGGDVAPKFRVVKGGDALRESGFIARTSAGDYGVPLSDAYARGAWHLMQGEALRRALLGSVECRFSLDGIPSVPTIEGIELAASWGSIYFDSGKASDNSGRQVVVTSRKEINLQIATLCACTGRRYVLRDSLAHSLNKVSQLMVKS